MWVIVIITRYIHNFLFNNAGFHLDKYNYVDVLDETDTHKSMHVSTFTMLLFCYYIILSLLYYTNIRQVIVMIVDFKIFREMQFWGFKDTNWPFLCLSMQKTYKLHNYERATELIVMKFGCKVYLYEKNCLDFVRKLISR